MFRHNPIRSLVLAALVVGVAVAVPVTALAVTKPVKPMILKPLITKLSVTSAKPNEKFLIDGKHFTHVTGVKVDGLRARYKVDSATKITATVPKKAKTGKVEVMTKAGTAFSLHALKII